MVLFIRRQIMEICQELKTSNNVFLIFTIFSISCSSVSDNSSSIIGDRWISTKNPRCDIWFQNWVDYERLFITHYVDTLNVEPSAYVTETTGKPYLKPKTKSVINTQQLIGNITWKKPPKWSDGNKNEFTWIVDRANPKKSLPIVFQGAAEKENDKMKLNITLSGDPYLTLEAQRIIYK